jgi:hypothetical protein
MHLVQVGRAVFEGERIRFLSAPEEIVERQRQDRLRAAEAQKLFEENRGRRMYWNGSDGDPRATHIPGDVRS